MKWWAATVVAALCALGGGAAEAATITVVDLTSGARTTRELTRSFEPELRWGADGTFLMTVISDRRGRQSVVRIDVGGSGAQSVVRRLGDATVSLSPDARTLAEWTFGIGQTLRLRDVASGALFARVPIAQGNWQLIDRWDVTWAPDGSRLALEGRTRRKGPQLLRVHDVRSGHLRCRLRGRAAATPIAFAPGGDRLLLPAWTLDRAARILEIDGCRTRGVPPLNLATPAPFAFAPAGDGLLYAGWDAFAAAPDGPVLPAGLKISAAELSPDGARVAYSTADEGGDAAGVAVMSLVPPYAAPRIIEPLGRSVVGRPAWSPDGTRIAFVTERGAR